MLQKYRLLLCCFLFTAISSCKNYLDVQPKGAYTADQVFSNSSAMQQALNGLYISLADSTLYGQFMTTTIIEMLGQRYQPPTGTESDSWFVGQFENYQYSDPNVQAAFDALWKKAYGTILAANVFIKNAGDAVNRHVVSDKEGQQLIGEAIAIRAMLHFDLLRLFGPVYALNPEAQAIPYYSGTDGNAQPLLSASKVMERVLSDLNTAAAMLSADPVITGGVVSVNDFYYGYRNQRLNYYAVKGLMARAYLWAGQKDQAHKQALEVLTQGEKWFPWTDPQAIQPLQDNPDRIFSNEILFSVYNPRMYNAYFTFFSPDLGNDHVLTADPDRLQEVYEGIANDYRYNENTWRATIITKKTFFKFADVPDISRPFRFLQPVLRKTELYYILAETETSPAQALQYLNTVRYNRNLVDLTGDADITVETAKEYMKEFWGEGQLFFYYKRTNTSFLPSGESPYYSVVPSYVVPLPLSETTPR
ncbi:RagB/SusD family nutrient uptake outer membrane protein [Chitinophaga sp.]|uniref:RagB/SusD family nutrient uptake outer membrane protein n=1 Tax=Chitinophaga sp. TaxID=1869181 RepID=UPI0031CFADC4